MLLTLNGAAEWKITKDGKEEKRMGNGILSSAADSPDKNPF